MDQRLLLVHAHPDDESIGQGATMAMYAAARHAGHAGHLHPRRGGRGAGPRARAPGRRQGGQPRRAPDHRAGERDEGARRHRPPLPRRGRAASATRGWSGTRRATPSRATTVKDGTFWQADLLEASDLLVEIIREVRPQVLVTYDQFGGYGHPDHIQAHRVATYATALAAVPSYRPELGEAWDIAKVYWSAMSASPGCARGCARCARPATSRRSRAWTPKGAMPPLHGPATSSSPPSSTADDFADAKMRGDEGARDPDQGRRPVLRAVEQPRQPGVGHRGTTGWPRGCPDPSTRTASRRTCSPACPERACCGWAACCSELPWPGLGRRPPGGVPRRPGPGAGHDVRRRLVAARTSTPVSWPSPSAGSLCSSVAVIGRPEGDYVVAADFTGYGLLVGGLSLLVVGVVSLPGGSGPLDLASARGLDRTHQRPPGDPVAAARSARALRRPLRRARTSTPPTGSRRNTSVNGIEVGGLRPAAAERKLAEGLGGRAAEPLVVTAMGRAHGHPASTAPVCPSTCRARSTGPGPRAVGTRGRCGTTSSAAPPRGGRAPSRARRSRTRSRRSPSTSTGPPSRGRDASAADRRPLATRERGIVVDRAAAADAVRTAFLRDNGPQDVVALPTREDRATVDADAVSRAMERVREPGDVGAGRRPARPTHRHDRARGLLLGPLGRARRLAAAAAGRPRRAAAAGAPDAAVRAAAAPGRQRAGRRRQAAHRRRTGGPHLRPEPAGRRLPSGAHPHRRRAHAGGPRAAAPAGGHGRRGPQAADHPRRVSAFTTRFPYAAYRNVNLGRAADLVDGTILEPGETFSLNDTVGERTAANGFTAATSSATAVFVEDFGGGVSQVCEHAVQRRLLRRAWRTSSTRRTRSTSSRYPIGREATVVWPDIDLKFKNTTPYGVLINASIDQADPVAARAPCGSRCGPRSTGTSRRRGPAATGSHLRVRRRRGRAACRTPGYAGFDIDVYRLWHRHGSTSSCGASGCTRRTSPPTG